MEPLKILTEEEALFNMEEHETLPNSDDAQFKLEEENKQGLWDTAKDQVMAGALGDVINVVKDTINESAGEGIRESFADSGMLPTPQKFESIPEEYRDQLTSGIPIHLHKEIMDSTDLRSAERIKYKVQREMDRDFRLQMQTGLSADGVKMLASAVDLDLPLVFMSGGMAGAAKVQRAVNTMATSRKARGALMGAAGVLQGGLITNPVSYALDPTYDWINVADNMLIRGAVGGVMGFLAPSLTTVSLGGDQPLLTAHKQLQSALKDPEHNIHNRPEDMGVASSEGAVDSSRSIWDEEDLETKWDDPIDKPEGSIGAANITPNPANKPQTFDEATTNWKKNVKWGDKQTKATTNLFYRVANDMVDKDTDGWAAVWAAKFMNTSTQDYADLFKSKAPGANWMAGVIFESANGFGRLGSTAATLQEMWSNSLAKSVVRPWEEAVTQFAIDTGNTMAGRYGIKDVAKAEFARLVRLEMNSRSLGRSGKAVVKVDGRNYAPNPSVQKAADALDAMHDQARMLMTEKGVFGSKTLRAHKGFLSYNWAPEKFLAFPKEQMVKALEQGYMSAGTFTSTDLANKVARAVYDRFSNRAKGIDAVDSRMMTLDNRDAMEQMFKDAGVPEREIKSLMIRLTKDAEERGKRGYLKSRNEIDLETPIGDSGLSLVDVMSMDIMGDTMRYMRSVAGSSALAAKGLRSSADIADAIRTINKQQEAVGEKPIPPDKLRAMLSPFTTGGAVSGYLRGHVNNGIDPYFATALQAARTSLLQQLGLSQLMDTTNIIAANGVKNFMDSGFTPMMNKMAKKDQQKLLDDLEQIGVILGKDHELFAPHLQLDEVSAVQDGVFQKYVRPFVQNAEKYTSFLSGFNHIQAQQQKMAAASSAARIMDDLSEMIKIKDDMDNPLVQLGESSATAPVVGSSPWKDTIAWRRIVDAGLEESWEQMAGLIQSGVIKKTDNGLWDLNIKAWEDGALTELFGSAMTRIGRQQVQKAMPGEVSVWMNSYLGRALTQLRTFGLISMQKQIVRNVHVMQTEVVGAAAMGMAGAYAALSLKDALNGKERSSTDRARLAITYSPMLGITGMTIDPIMAMMGFDNYGISPYAQYASPISVPVVETTAKMLRFPGAVIDKATGTADYQDQADFRSMFMMNMAGMQRIF